LNAWEFCSCFTSAGNYNHCQDNKITGLQTGRQTVNHGDIFCFGNEEQNEAIISGDEIVRTKFVWAKFEQEEVEKEHWLMWY